MKNNIKIYIASDHAGFELKEYIIANLSTQFEVLDYGTHSNEVCNYNEIAEKMLQELQMTSSDFTVNTTNFGILICKSGNGMSIVANRFEKIRAINATQYDQVKLARLHNNSNVICFGEQFITKDDSLSMIFNFLNTEFEGGRHVNRLIFDAKKCINLNYNGVIPSNYLEIKHKLKYFPCGEFEFSIQEDIGEKEITIFQSFTRAKFNDDLMKLQIVCDVLQRNDAKIIYFAPFLPYTRQDRSYDTTSSLGSKLVGNIINNAGISHIITYDLHALQIEGFFKGKVQNRSMIPAFIKDIQEKFDINTITIIFPDAGSASRFKRFFSDTNFKIAIINKNRTENGLSMDILGDVGGKNAIIIDDMIDGGGTMIEAANLLISKGAINVFAYATHGIFSANAIENLANSKISNITVSNSLSHENNPKITSITTQLP
ncbi:ribose-phosphate diphosphokinase [Candidatus Deianiraea vastatrix]|nr:ribose-phosphate diphosphokinase [Candidatus Deianiraea vastatrix]